MKSIVFRYGIRASVMMVIMGAVQVFLLLPYTGYSTGEVTGYLSILIAMSFIFFGIKKYRSLNGGVLSFGQGLKIGLLIALIPAVFFGLFDLLYTEVINPDWGKEYYQYQAARIKDTAPPDQVDTKITELQAQWETYGKPHMMFLLMFASAFIIGVIVTIISALTLRRNKPAQA